MTTKVTSTLGCLGLLLLMALPIKGSAQDSSVSISFDPLPEQCVDDPNNCTSFVTYTFQLELTNCPFGQLQIEALVNFFNDGNPFPIPNTLSGSFPNYSLSSNFPQGAHSFEVTVSDGCGGVQTASLPFEVVDCDVSAPVCATGENGGTLSAGYGRRRRD